MKTHTLRNKSSATPILTLTPKFFEKAMSCYPEAFTLALHWFNVAYKRETGKPVRLDHAQQQAFLQSVGATPSGEWRSKFSGLSFEAFQLTSLMTRGIEVTPGLDFEGVLDIAQAFYVMLDKSYSKATPADSANPA